jgi:hypothetical protein
VPHHGGAAVRRRGRRHGHVLVPARVRRVHPAGDAARVLRLKDLGIEKEAVDDRTPDFPLGKRALAENRRLLRKQLKRCARQSGAAKRAACRSAARERFPG